MKVPYSVTPKDDAYRLARTIDNELSCKNSVQISFQIAIKCCRELILHLQCCTEFGIDETKKEDFHSSTYQYWCLVIDELELMKIEHLKMLKDDTATTRHI